MLWLYTTKVGVKNRLSSNHLSSTCQILTWLTWTGRCWPPFVCTLFLCIPKTGPHTHTHIHGHSKMDIFNMCTELFFPVFFDWKKLCRVILGESFGKRHLRKLVRSWPFHLHLTSFSFFLTAELFPRESFQPPDHYLSTQLSHITCTGGGGVEVYNTCITALAYTLPE